MGESAGQLPQGDVQFVRIVGIDHAQHGFRLGQINSAGQKRPQRELPWPCQTGARGAERPQNGLQQGGRAERMNLDHRLAGVASPVRPRVGVAGKRPAEVGKAQRADDDAGKT